MSSRIDGLEFAALREGMRTWQRSAPFTAKQVPARGRGWIALSVNVQSKLNELSERNMASVNKVILIGSIGRDSGESRYVIQREIYDGYLDALRRYRDALFEDMANAFAAAARRLNEALRQLRILAGPLVVPKEIAIRRTAMFNRTAAFFHAAKVDARNLP